MPDISMCSNKDCEKKEECYRFMAVPSNWQSYMKPEAKDCKFFWKVEPNDRLREIKEDD